MVIKRRIETTAACLGALSTMIAISHQATAAGNDSMCIKNGMVHGLLDLDQSSLRSCTGKLYGLEDDRGRSILRSDFSDLEYCGHGLFLATDVQKWNRYYFGDQRHFFNRNGVELKYRLPEKAFLLNIFSFGRKADKAPSLLLHKLPTDTVLLFGIRGNRQTSADIQQGLCNLSGEILFPAIRGRILFLESGSAFVVRDSGACSIVSLKNWSETPTKLQYSPGSVPAPRIPRTRNYPVLMPFPKDRVRTEASQDNGSFDHDYWCDKRDRPVQAIEMFDRFLHEYNLIGMQKDRVAVLLGESDHADPWARSGDAFVYKFPMYSCTGDYSAIKVYFENEQVSKWSFITSNVFSLDAGEESDFITTNVVLNQPNSGRLVITGHDFPATAPKEERPPAN